MKIGILTHHYIKNYGAFLQTYALQEMLKKEFPNDEVYIINYINRKHLFINICGWFRFNPKKDSIKSYLQKITIPHIFNKFEKTYLNTTKKVYTVEQVNKLAFDCIVIGSDEVWNYDDRKSYDPIKFGKELICKNIISYAPSIGKSDLNHIPLEIKKCINNIKSFSAREDGAEKLVRKLTNSNCKRVLDPTLLYEFPIYHSKLVDKLKNENYILMYYCDGLSQNLQDKIIDYAKKNQLKIYGAGEYKQWFDYFPINVNPFEWIEMFRNAQIVFNGTFHGTVFSIKCEKIFLNYTNNPSRIKKVESLLEELKIAKRNLKTDDFYNSKINYKIVNKVLHQKIKESIKYLNTSIRTDDDTLNKN